MKKSVMTVLTAMMIMLTGVHAGTIRVPGDETTIQAALDAAVNGDTVLIADGTYTGPENRGLDTQGKEVFITSENGRDYCVIDCESADRGFLLDDDETLTCRIEGITIRNGYRSGNDGSGGAIECYESSPSIIECRFEFNEATNGAAVRCTRGSSAHIEGCEFIENEGTDGGAVHVSSNSHPTIHGCIFESNYCTNGGGIYCMENSSPTISSCIFQENIATNGGGIACDHHSSPIVINCLMANCSATNGGGVYCSDSSPSLIACTLADNLGTTAGGIFSLSSNPTVSCSIIWNGGRDEISGSCQVTYSDVSGGWPGAGNMDQNPEFVQGPETSYYLSHIASGQGSNSPCIDAGGAAASAVCITLPTGSACLDTLSTRTDGGADQGTADLGYHHPASIPAAVSLWMPDTYFTPGEDCSCIATVENMTDDTLSDHPLFVILDVFGSYYFGPSFSDFDYYSRSFPPGSEAVTVLSTFTWPQGAGSADGLMWYGALTNRNMTALFGLLGTWTFGFGEP